MRVGVSGSPTHLIVNPSRSDFENEVKMLRLVSAGTRAKARQGARALLSFRCQSTESDHLVVDYLQNEHQGGNIHVIIHIDYDICKCRHNAIYSAVLPLFEAHDHVFQAVFFNWQGLQCLHSIGLKSRML